MSYKLITGKNSPNYGYNPHGSRGGNTVKYIVIHHWGKDGQSFDGVVNWLCRSNGNSSAHYVLEAGKVACIIDHKNCAWHAGNKWYNQHSIGIECRPECRTGDVDTLVELLADLFKIYGVLPVIGHKDIVATACPYRYYSKLGDIKARAIKLMQTGKMTNAKVSKSTSTIKKATSSGLSAKQATLYGQKKSNQILGTKIAQDGIWGSDTKKNAVKILQWAMNKDYGSGLKIDGIFGAKSKRALGNHYVRSGETQYMVTACEVLLYMNGYNPKGVEIPGTFGSGLKKAVGQYQAASNLEVDYSCGKNTFRKLIS